MNGWLRLWVLLSVVWAVLVVSAAAIVIPDKQEAAIIEDDKLEAEFTEDELLGAINLAAEEGNIAVANELSATYFKMFPIQESGAKENQHKRQEVIRTSIMASIIPPLVLLMLGYGVAWVRRGFRAGKSQKR